MKKILALVVALAAAALWTTSAMAAHDHFNRTNLGARWVVNSGGSFFITNNQLQGATGSIGSFKPSRSDTDASVFVYLPDTSLIYGAVASGDIAGGNNAFVKIQADDGSGQFVHGAFYTGNNGSGNFFALNSPVPSPAKLSLYFCDTVAHMVIRSSAGVQKYSMDYGTTFPTGAGLGTYGNVALDNYASKAGGCTLNENETVINASNASKDKDPTLSK